MNTLFSKVLGENEKCVFYIYLKTKGTFWPTQYNVNLMWHYDYCFVQLMLIYIYQFSFPFWCSSFPPAFSCFCLGSFSLCLKTLLNITFRENFLPTNSLNSVCLKCAYFTITVFLNFIYLFICLFIYFLAALCSMWDLTSPTRDRTHTACIGSVKS